ncbi:DUF4267 domain-containing protein [Streptomyces sp. NPDC059687]|uniref:DUF4267 domain-containing protein n=1 Tax=unclassified Streptomyces TaxID=2593676 RepID=UPI0036BF1B5D
MLTSAAYGLALLLDLFVLVIGARFLLQPRAAAIGYGVPAEPGGDAAYLEIKGLRDASTGILGLAVLAFAGAHAEAWFMVAAALLPLGDALIVLRHGGTRAAAFGIHFVTAAVVPVSAALLFLA